MNCISKFYYLQLKIFGGVMRTSTQGNNSKLVKKNGKYVAIEIEFYVSNAQDIENRFFV